MMNHRKKEHLHEIKDCKNIVAGLNFRKGMEFCWYRHDRVGTNLRSTSRSTMTTPSYTLPNFPYEPTPQGPVVGQDNVSLQMIHQTLQVQQQQMTVMMAELLKLKQ